MARSENQGLQIAVILLAILTIILSITTFLCFNQWTNAQKQADAAVVEADKSRTVVNDTDRDLIALLSAASGSPQGIPGDATARVDGDYKLDMERWQKAPDVQQGGFSLPKEKLSYHDALEEALTQLKNTKAAEVKIRGDVKTQTTGELDPIQPTLATQSQQKETQRQADAQKFFTEKGNSEKAMDTAFKDSVEQTKKIAEKTQLANLPPPVLEKLQRLPADPMEKTELLTDNKIEQETRLEAADEKVQYARQANEGIEALLTKLLRKDYDGKDGEVRRVDYDNRVVWINLGNADNLRSQIRFRVYGMSPKGVEKEQEKAEIEVLRVAGAHMAECRIIRDHFTSGTTVVDELTGREASDRNRYSLLNPIMPGDVLCTPLWNPGDEIHYALAGSMDIDGDGQDDRILVKTLLAAAGAVIDAEALPDGTTIGTIGLQTRYVVLGSAPEAAKTAVEAMNDLARKQGVEPLTLQKLLDKLGAGMVDPKAINKVKASAAGAAASPAEPFRRQPPPKENGAGDAEKPAAEKPAADAPQVPPAENK